MATARLDAQTLALEKKPSPYWTLLPALEMVRLCQRHGKTPRDTLAVWLKRIRPSVEACARIHTEDREWMTWAPNTLHQGATGLELAWHVYRAHEPEDPALATWRTLAKKCIRSAAAKQLPGGAFSYIHDSGPDPSYYNFDSTFLGRYFQLSRDPVALAGLRRMKAYSRSATISGWLEGVSSPWWKHIWGSSGPAHGPEIIAGATGDRLAKGVAQLRLPIRQPYYFIYYSMYFWDPKTTPLPVSDRCEYDANANGPALRRGGFDVIMPGQAWGDTAFWRFALFTGETRSDAHVCPC